ncbi:TRAP transporter substrate-binding protein [Aureimonas fodinaquatilis]|nr:TRAP transporter substrate-binding protein [Aureimonas fodinaquatilis]
MLNFKAGALPISLALLGALTSATFAADYTARFSLDVREDNPKYRAAQIFAELVAEKTDGAVEIQLFPNSLLGGEAESAEGMRIGSVHMGILTSSVLAQWVPQLQVLDLPFVFESDEHVMSVSEPLTEALKQNFTDNGFHLLGFTPNGGRSLISKTQIADVADVAGKRMRVIQSPIHVALWEAAGANPVPIPAPEIYNSMQTGVIDLFDNTASNYLTSRFFEVAPYYTPLSHIYAIGTWVVADSWVQSLPEEHRAALQEAALEAQAAYAPLLAEADAAALQATVEQGSTIVEEFDRQAWVDRLSPVRERFAAEIPDAEPLLAIITEATPAE